MKKIGLLLAAGIFMMGSVSAQKAVKENVTINKQVLPGFSVSLEGLNASVASAAMEDYLGKQGLTKPGKLSGFIAYLNQNIPQFGTLNYDVYAKAQQEGKKKENKSKIYFLITKGNMNPLTESSDQEVIGKIMAFLDAFVPYAYGYSVGQNIASLEGDLAKQQKKLESLTKKREKEQAGIEKMTKEINDLQTQINGTQADLKKAKDSLQQFKK